MNRQELDHFKHLVNLHLNHLTKINAKKYNDYVSSLKKTKLEISINRIFTGVVTYDGAIVVSPSFRSGLLQMRPLSGGPSMECHFHIQGFKLQCQVAPTNKVSSAYNFKFYTNDLEHLYTFNIDVLEFDLMTEDEKLIFFKSRSKELYKNLVAHLKILFEKNSQSRESMVVAYEESSVTLENFLELIKSGDSQ